MRSPRYTLDFENVTKRYGHEIAVDNLSFTVRPGRVTGFLGPNGAGKSTTMKILIGFYTIKDSAHSPAFEEPDRTLQILTENVLTGTTTLADRTPARSSPPEGTDERAPRDVGP